MNFLVFMQIIESFERVEGDLGDLVLIQVLLGDSDQIDDAACGAIFHDQPELVAFEIGPVVPS